MASRSLPPSSESMLMRRRRWWFPGSQLVVRRYLSSKNIWKSILATKQPIQKLLSGNDSDALRTSSPSESLSSIFLTAARALNHAVHSADQAATLVSSSSAFNTAMIAKINAATTMDELDVWRSRLETHETVMIEDVKNGWVFHALVKAYLRFGQRSTSQEIVGKLVQANRNARVGKPIPPVRWLVSAYFTMMDHALRSHNLVDASRIYSVMLATFTLSSATMLAKKPYEWTILAKFFAQLNDRDRVLEIWSAMEAMMQRFEDVRTLYSPWPPIGTLDVCLGYFAAKRDWITVSRIVELIVSHQGDAIIPTAWMSPEKALSLLAKPLADNGDVVVAMKWMDAWKAKFLHDVDILWEGENRVNIKALAKDAWQDASNAVITHALLKGKFSVALHAYRNRALDEFAPGKAAPLDTIASFRAFNISEEEEHVAAVSNTRSGGASPGGHAVIDKAKLLDALGLEHLASKDGVKYAAHSRDKSRLKPA